MVENSDRFSASFYYVSFMHIIVVTVVKKCSGGLYYILLTLVGRCFSFFFFSLYILRLYFFNHLTNYLGGNYFLEDIPERDFQFHSFVPNFVHDSAPFIISIIK